MKLLIIEDEKKLADSIAKGFKAENFNIDIAYDGKVGLDLLNVNEYDAVILDLMLPKITGLEILTQIRNNELLVPVLILTAKDTIEDKIKGLNNGSDDYLAKPFSFDELLARIRSLIRRATKSSPTLQVADLIMEPEKHSVKRADQLIHLSAKEFALLEYLIYHKGIILSATQIIDHIWDYNSTASSNIVAAQIKNLRSKIDKPFPNSRKLIKTIRGVGYKLDVNE